MDKPASFISYKSFTANKPKECSAEGAGNRSLRYTQREWNENRKLKWT